MKYIFTAEEIVEIQESRRRNRDKNVERRLKALELKAAGHTGQEIAEMTDYNSGYISKLAAKYRKGGIEAITGNHYGGNNGTTGIGASMDIPILSQNITPKISLNRTSLSLKAGESQTLTANVTPSGTAVSWSSSDTHVATIDRSGRITAVSSGSTTIIAEMYYDGQSYTGTCQVTVTDSIKELAYTFKMQMTIIADDAIVSALQNTGFNMSAIVDTSGYIWRYSDGFFLCDTSISVSYNTLKTIDGMEFWDFQYSHLDAQLYKYN